MKKKLSLALAATLFVSACQKPTPPVTSTSAPPAVTSAVVESPADPLQAVSPSPAANLEAVAILGDLSVESTDGITLVPDHSGQEAKAFSFSGEKTSLSAEVNINPEVMPQCTLVTWARYTGEPDSSATQQVVSHDNGGYDRSIGIDRRAGSWGWSCFAGNRSVVGGFPVEPGQWIFLAALYDQPAKTLTFYAGQDKLVMDDVELGTGLETTSLGTNPTHGEFFQGDIEPVQVYDRILTDQEIETLRRR